MGKPKKQIRGVMKKSRGPFVATVRLDPSQVVDARRKRQGTKGYRRAC